VVPVIRLRSRQLGLKIHRALIVTFDDDRRVGIKSGFIYTVSHRQPTEVMYHALSYVGLFVLRDMQVFALLAQRGDKCLSNIHHRNSRSNGFPISLMDNFVR